MAIMDPKHPCQIQISEEKQERDKDNNMEFGTRKADRKRARSDCQDEDMDNNPTKKRKLSVDMTDEEIWDAYYDEYSKEPESIECIQNYYQFNLGIKMSWTEAKSVFNCFKGTKSKK